MEVFIFMFVFSIFMLTSIVNNCISIYNFLKSNKNKDDKKKLI